MNFVKTGDPNGGALPRWPAYRGKDGAMMDFATTGTAVAGTDPWANAATAPSSANGSPGPRRRFKDDGSPE